MSWTTYGRNANHEWLTTGDSATFIGAVLGSMYYLRRGWQIKIEKRRNNDTTK